MAKRIIAAFIIIVVCVAGYWAYTRYASNARLRNGDVTVADSDDSTARPTPVRAETSGDESTAPAAATTKSQSASFLQLSQAIAPAAASAPATDSQAPNAPNGMAFSGSGQYQVYRQGNLTWRINTSDGSTCILFATNEEWRKPIVYNHGCPNS